MSFLLSTSPGMKTGIYPNLGRDCFDPPTLFVGDFLRHEDHSQSNSSHSQISKPFSKEILQKTWIFWSSRFDTVNNKTYTPHDERLEPENTGPRNEKENILIQTIMFVGSTLNLRGCRCLHQSGEISMVIWVKYKGKKSKRITWLASLCWCF